MKASEARTQWKEVLDRAVNGEVIEIERSGVIFILASKKAIRHAQNTDSQKLEKNAPDVEIEQNRTNILPERRTPSTVIDEINAYKADLAERLEYCQDPETRSGIEREGNDTINAMWAEYHQLKADQ